VTVESAETIGFVGSPSTAKEVTLDIVGEAATSDIVGKMILVEQGVGDRVECALGTITDMTTRNQWHENIAMRGVIATHGPLPNLSGKADVKGATVRLQAVYQRALAEQSYRQLGASLSCSPATGSTIRRVTDEALCSLIAAEMERVYYIGEIYRCPEVRLPLNLTDFSGSEGAYHTAYLGRTRSGKSACAAYDLAGRIGRYPSLGVLIVDPQGQWAGQEGFPFDLQGWARALGRSVVVRRIATDLRLKQDATLLADLLAKTPFFARLRIPKGEKVHLAAAELAEVLRGKDFKGWAERDPDTLLVDLLTRFIDGPPDKSHLGAVYVKGEAYNRVSSAIQTLIDESDHRQQRLAGIFGPLHNLFHSTNLEGAPRHSLWGTLQELFSVGGGARSMVVLDMSSRGLSLELGEDADDDAGVDLLDDEEIKARILNRVCFAVEQVARSCYEQGRMLNTLVLFDEAHRYAAPSRPDTPEAVRVLADGLVKRVRETGKYGLGWTFITQAPTSIHAGIWDQLSVRVVSYGLAGVELRKIEEQLDHPESVDLYRAFADPRSTQPRQYPFMLLGACSPLSFTKAPVFMSAFTSFQSFLEANKHWVPAELALQPERFAVRPKPRPQNGQSPTTTPARDLDDAFLR